MVEQLGDDLVLPACVLVELDYWIQKLLGADAWTILVDDITNGAYRLESVTLEDLQRAADPYVD